MRFEYQYIFLYKTLQESRKHTSQIAKQFLKHFVLLVILSSIGDTMYNKLEYNTQVDDLLFINLYLVNSLQPDLKIQHSSIGIYLRNTWVY